MNALFQFYCGHVYQGIYLRDIYQYLDGLNRLEFESRRAN